MRTNSLSLAFSLRQPQNSFLKTTNILLYRLNRPQAPGLQPHELTKNKKNFNNLLSDHAKNPSFDIDKKGQYWRITPVRGKPKIVRQNINSAHLEAKKRRRKMIMDFDSIMKSRRRNNNNNNDNNFSSNNNNKFNNKKQQEQVVNPVVTLVDKTDFQAGAFSSLAFHHFLHGIGGRNNSERNPLLLRSAMISTISQESKLLSEISKKLSMSEKNRKNNININNNNENENEKQEKFIDWLDISSISNNNKNKMIKVPFAVSDHIKIEVGLCPSLSLTNNKTKDSLSSSASSSYGNIEQQNNNNNNSSSSSSNQMFLLNPVAPFSRSARHARLVGKPKPNPSLIDASSSSISNNTSSTGGIPVPFSPSDVLTQKVLGNSSSAQEEQGESTKMTTTNNKNQKEQQQEENVFIAWGNDDENQFEKILVGGDAGVICCGLFPPSSSSVSVHENLRKNNTSNIDEDEEDDDDFLLDNTTTTTKTKRTLSSTVFLGKGDCLYIPRGWKVTCASRVSVRDDIKDDFEDENRDYDLMTIGKTVPSSSVSVSVSNTDVKMSEKQDDVVVVQKEEKQRRRRQPFLFKFTYKKFPDTGKFVFEKDDDKKQFSNEKVKDNNMLEVILHLLLEIFITNPLQNH